MESAPQVLLGFFTRPWRGYTVEEAVAGIAASGARLIGYMPQPGMPLVNRDSLPEEVDALKALVAQHGLEPAVYVPRVPLSLPDNDYLAAWDREIAVAVRLGTPYLQVGGTNDASQYDRYVLLMQQVAKRAGRHGCTIVLKPHGGISATAADCLRVVQQVAHPAFRITYDPGNVIYYTGTDPLAGLEALAPYVVALCIKDSTGGRHGSVHLQPGRGDVDLARLFTLLRDAGFRGPALVETLAEGPLEEINRQARETIEYLRRLLY
jgi:sugar phosphate isomerase/epimerase